MKIKISFFAFAMSVMFGSCDDDGDKLKTIVSDEQKLAEIESIIEEDIVTHEISALSAGVIKNGKIIWQKGFGIHNQTQNIQASNKTLYWTSSIGKLIVAVAAMQQFEQGNIDFDEDASTYLGFELRNPNFPDDIITPRLMLTHQSSLANPDVATVPEVYTVASPDSVFRMADWVSDIIPPTGSKYNANVWDNIKPGTVHKNSNMGMVLMAHIVEKVSGLDFREYAKQKIFDPLGMINTSYNDNELDPSLMADMIAPDGTFFAPFDFAMYASGSMRTSVEDWLRFFQAILNDGSLDGEQILQPSSVDIMLDAKYVTNGLPFASGVGIVWRAYGFNADWLGHTGAGLITGSTDLNRELKSAVIIFCNGTAKRTVSPDPQSGRIYNALHQFMYE